MKELMRRCGALLPTRHDERGATATEYGLLVGFIAMVIVVGVLAFGTALDLMFDGFVTALGGIF